MTLEEIALRIATLQVGESHAAPIAEERVQVEAVRLGPGRYMVQAAGDEAVSFVSQTGPHWTYAARLVTNGRTSTNGVRYRTAQDALATALRFFGLLGRFSKVGRSV
jgi:hypothetical protein